MTKFYFVRHGQTGVNLRHAFNGGGVDEPLTTLGVAQAQQMGQYLTRVRFAQAISSSMPRAVTTTHLILAKNAYPTPLATANGLRELRLGPWDGQIEADVSDTQALDAYFHRPAEFDAKYAPDLGIEPYGHLLKRSRAVIQAAYAAHPAANLLVVGHGILFQFLLNSLLGVPFDELRKPPMLHNATLSRLDTLDGQHYVRRQWDFAPTEN